MKTSALVYLFSLGLALVACQSSPRTEAPAASSENSAEANLKQGEAATRASVVGAVHYRLHIGLNNGPEKFTGSETAEFQLKSAAHGLFMDFADGAEITKLELNGASLPLTAYANHRIQLPDASLKVGANTLSITYKQAYGHNGRGLHRFEDPEDHRIYMHTQFEAFDAHLLFPCFDQPDLKATYRLTVTAPKDYEIVSTTREESIKPEGADRQWSFPDTPKISTYLFSLHAGPYKVWTSKAGAIPLRLFARQSLARYVHPEDWFRPTQQGLAFYGSFFGYNYPFKKYDSLIVPDFNAGAMENVAAITFTERYVKRGLETRDERANTASVILHEMAHQWFGDLVTMRWWNALWLNESFATYMSALAMARATEYTDSWMRFYSGSKERAYYEDQLVTTHPIDGEVPDTQAAFANFDAITYGKGASVLKQLSAMMGETHFRDGLRAYFQQNAYSNTTLQDFISALQQAAPHQHLQAWSQAWLSQAGLDSVHPRLTCSGTGPDASIANVSLVLLGPDGSASPREHKTRVQLYKKSGGKLVAGKAVDITYGGAETQVPDLVGAPCPALVDVNANDDDYVKVQLGSTTLATVRASISSIDSAFVRERMWGSLFQMVRDKQFLPQDYLAVVNTQLAKETDLKVGTLIMRSLAHVIYYVPEANNQEKNAKLALIEKVENTLWERAAASAPGSDWQTETMDGFMRTVQSHTGENRLVQLLNGESRLRSVRLDQDRRWEIIQILSSLNDSRATDLLDREKKRDRSERGVQMAMAAEAARPLLNVKEDWFNRTLEDKTMSFSRKRAVLNEMLPGYQDELRMGLSTKYFDVLPKLARNSDEGYLGLVTSAMMPVVCTEGSAQTLEAFMKDHGEFPTPVVKRLRQGIQEDRRCAGIRADAAVGKSSTLLELW